MTTTTRPTLPHPTAIHPTTARPGLRILVRDTDGSEHTALLAGDRDRYLVGRRDAGGSVSDLVLEDRHVSRRHCAIAWSEAESVWTVTDLNSANGTRLDGEPVYEEPVALRDGARINLGATLLVVHRADADDENLTAVAPPERPGEDATAIDTTAIDATEVAGGGNATVLLKAPPPPAVRATAHDETEVAPQPQPAPASDPTLLHDRPVPDPTASVPPAPALEAIAEAGAEAPVGRAADRKERRATPRDEGDVLLSGPARALVDANLLDGPKAIALCRVARETGRTFFRTLAGDGTVRLQDEIYARVAQLLRLETIDTEKDLMAQAMATRWLPFALAAQRGAVLLNGGGETVRYATIDPFDVPLDDWIARCAGRPTERLLVTPTIFQSALQRLKDKGAGIEEEDDSKLLVVRITPELEHQINTNIREVDAPNLVNYFIQRAWRDGASDIHIEPTESSLLVRYRVDGILHEMLSMDMDMHPEIASRIKILSGMDVAEKRRPQDGRISSSIVSDDNGDFIDVRVSSYPTIYGEKMVMRLLDKNALRPSPEHLGMLPRDLRLLYDKLGAPFGLVMISGPTGSGKTTTLYSCLGSIDKHAKNVLTVEDPVEYRLKGVHQMQVNDRIGLTFASGLRTILRQDPDVIMVGECRDTETSGMAIQAALTGHIVFSTIHTNDAVGVVTRLLDMGIDRFLVANALTLAMAQRLVRKVCRDCLTYVPGTQIRKALENDGISAERLDTLGIEIDDTISYAHGMGCVHCRNTGYRGRQAVFEVFEMTNAARNMILAPDFNADDLRRMAHEAGMTTLISHGLQLIEDGVTTHAEVIRVLGESY